MLARPRPPVAPSSGYQLPPSEYHPCRAHPARCPGRDWPAPVPAMADVTQMATALVPPNREEIRISLAARVSRTLQIGSGRSGAGRAARIPAGSRLSPTGTHDLIRIYSNEVIYLSLVAESNRRTTTRTTVHHFCPALSARAAGVASLHPAFTWFAPVLHPRWLTVRWCVLDRTYSLGRGQLMA